MARSWRWLAAPGTGSALLLLTALWLAVGAATMWLVPGAFRPLMRGFLSEWFATVLHEPWLWWWMAPLFATVAVVGASTAVCVVDVVARPGADAPLSGRRLGMAAFHLCVLFFLMGHLLMEFAGVNVVVPLRRGEAVSVPEAGLTLTLAAIDDAPVADLPDAPLRRRLDLEVTRAAVTLWRSPAVMSPSRAHDLDLHVPIYGGPPPGFDAAVQVRRNPGLPWFLAGVAVLVLGCILAGPWMASRVGAEVSRRGDRS